MTTHILSLFISLSLLLFFFPSSSLAWGGGCSNNTVVFNNNASCLTGNGCSFTDPTIWQNGVIPSHMDQVIMVGNSSAVKVYVKTFAVMGCLTIQNIQLTVQQSVFVVNYDFISANTSIYVSNSGHASISWVQDYAGEIDFINQTFISVGADSKFEAGNSVNATLYFDDTSTLKVDSGGAFLIVAGETSLEGNLFIASNASFTASGGVYTIVDLQQSSFLSPVAISYLFIPTNSNVSFSAGLTATAIDVAVSSSLYLGHPLVVSHSITIANLSTVYFVENIETTIIVSGNGSIFLASANIELSTDNFDGSVTLAGQTTINFENATITDLAFGNYGSKPTYVDIIIGGHMELSSLTPVTIPGNISVHGSLSLEGQYHITGSLFVFTGYVYVQGEAATLRVDSSINLVTRDTDKSPPPQFFSANGTIITPAFLISPRAVLNLAQGLVTFSGTNKNIMLTSSGIIVIPNGVLLYINGSYTSATGSVIRAEGLLYTIHPRMQVVQNAFLVDGTIEYTIEGTPSKGSPYLVMSAGSIKGDFGSNLPNDISNKTKGEMLFQDNSVYVHFEGDIKHHRGMPWYAWIFIAIGISSIFGFVYVYHKRKQRALQQEQQKYQRVNM